MKKLIAAFFITAICLGISNVFAEEITLTPREEIIRQILEENYNYNATGLLKAMKDGNTDCVSLFLSAGLDPNTTIMKLPAVYWAIKLNKPDIVDKLLIAGADPNLVVNGKSLTAHAISAGNADTVRVLLKHGAKVNDASAGKSLLTLALTKKSDEISNVLIDAGAKIDEDSLAKALKLQNSALKEIILTNYKKQG